MLFRLLFTAISLLMAAGSVLVLDCSAGSISFLADDPLSVCSYIDRIGAQGSVWIGAGLAAAAGLLLAIAWVPSLRSSHYPWPKPEEALRENLDRVASPPRQPSTAYTGAGHRMDILRRVEAVEAALLNDETAPREATEKWMSLLKETNNLHAEGKLSTEDFVEVNSRLVELLDEPVGEPEEAVAG